MKTLLFQLAVKALFAILTPDLAQKLYEELIAKIDTYVEKTPWSIDDIIWGAIKAGVEVMQEIGDAILDFVEDYVLGTKSTIDDALVLPACELVRQVLNIPDND